MRTTDPMLIEDEQELKRDESAHTSAQSRKERNLLHMHQHHQINVQIWLLRVKIGIFVCLCMCYGYVCAYVCVCADGDVCMSQRLSAQLFRYSYLASSLRFW